MSTIKRTTSNYSLRIPIFDKPGWGREMERNFDIVDAVMFAISSFTNIKGVWTNGTAYDVFDRVVDDATNTIWSCLVSHTSPSTGTFEDARDANPTYWELTTTTIVNRGNWTAATDYNTNDFVISGARVGVVPIAYTSGASYDADVADGKIVTLVDMTTQLAQASASASAAATSATNANNSATAAANSATTASTQAGIATTKATQAGTSEANAAASAADALTYRTSAINSATTATNKATEASNSATAAATSASAAATSATNAATSKTGADTAKTAAETARNKAQSWADENEDVAVETGKFSAKHHALKAAASAAAIAAGTVAGFRNKIINGDFDIWQRGTSLASAAVSRILADRWMQSALVQSCAQDRIAFAKGITTPPGNPEYYHRTTITGGSGASDGAYIEQRIEDVRTLAGKRATLTFYVSTESGKPVACEFVQVFGTTGTPSSPLVVTTDITKFDPPDAGWYKCQTTVDIPSLAGKTVTDGSYLVARVWYSAGPSYGARTGNIGLQTGSFNIAHVSLVEGDATGEADPFPPRHIQQELALCQRYYELIPMLSMTSIGAGTHAVGFWKVRKREQPTLTYSFNTGTGGGYSPMIGSGDEGGCNAIRQTVAHSATATATVVGDAEF